jgi:sugar/nucleoside kinase (ribokinase family)
LSQKKKLLPLLKLVDFILLNKTEAETLVGLDIDDKKFWNSLVSFSSAIISVTNGHDGAFVFVDGRHYFSPIINVKPVDETGAGDSFGSTFIAATIYGYSVQDSLFWAIKNSASVVAALGAKTGLLVLSKISK